MGPPFINPLLVTDARPHDTASIVRALKAHHAVVHDIHREEREERRQREATELQAAQEQAARELAAHGRRAHIRTPTWVLKRKREDDVEEAALEQAARCFPTPAQSPVGLNHPALVHPQNPLPVDAENHAFIAPQETCSHQPQGSSQCAFSNAAAIHPGLLGLNPAPVSPHGSSPAAFNTAVIDPRLLGPNPALASPLRCFQTQFTGAGTIDPQRTGPAQPQFAGPTEPWSIEIDFFKMLTPSKSTPNMSAPHTHASHLNMLRTGTPNMMLNRDTPCMPMPNMNELLWERQWADAGVGADVSEHCYDCGLSQSVYPDPGLLEQLHQGPIYHIPSAMNADWNARSTATIWFRGTVA